MKDLISQAFQERFSSHPALMVRAPGRVNLIGEHTDYNDGFVLPMAIDRAIWVAMRPRPDRRVRLYSVDFPEPADFNLDGIVHQAQGWSEYVKGVAWALQESGLVLNGWEGVLGGDVPVGAGLSSSAALELAVARAFQAVSAWTWDGSQAAQAARRADNAYVGISSGIMDHMIVAHGRAGHAMLLDCRSLAIDHVPLPPGIRVVVLDTGTRRELLSTAYDQRVVECQAAARAMGVTSLREASLEALQDASGRMEAQVFRRARHVISENDRTLAAFAAMEQGAGGELGRLMDASHASLRDDYEVSSPALEAMVAASRRQPGCLGARLTGAGFGGCAVALVEEPAVDTFTHSVLAAYQQATGLRPDVYVCMASNGAEIINP